MTAKRLLAIDQGEHLGGAERFLADLLNHLSKDLEVHLLTTGKEGYLSLYRGSTVHIHQSDLPQLKPIGFKTYRSYRRAQKNLHQQVEQIKPDVVISNTVRTHLISSPVVHALNIPLIWMGHDLTFPQVLLKRFQKYPQQLIACSHYIESYYQAQRRMPSQVLYPFAVDTLSQNLVGKHRQKKIGMVGKFIPWKGQREFIQACSMLVEKFPSYRFVLVADSYKGRQESEEYADSCRQLVEDLKLTKRFDIKSGIPDLVQEMSQWEVLVHCSQEPEPLGRVILEGMAAGAAVIGSKSGGPKEIIQHEVNGLLVDPNPRELSGAMERILKDDQQRKELQQQGLNTIAERFTWKALINCYHEVFKRLIDEDQKSKQ